MNDKIQFTQEELQLLDIACMSYSSKLSEIAKSIPFEEPLVSGSANVDGLARRAKKFWELSVKIAGYMEECE
jgi:hypothetical protein